MPRINFQTSQTGNRYYATADGGPRFYVASDVIYQGNHGLSNNSPLATCLYQPTDYIPQYGFWAWFIYPTAICESKGSFFCVNSYDRAAFTFSFMQFAAHVPNGDFVKYLRRLLQLTKAKDYFPFLELRNGIVWYNNGTTQNQLENTTAGAQENTAMMNYFNPDKTVVDNQEIISTTRMVHWAQNDIENQKAQVQIAVEVFKANMRRHCINYNLNGMPDYICHAITDIHHQGRARVSFIQNILNANVALGTKYQNLLNVGAGVYDERIRTLKARHRELLANGIFGTKKYDEVSNDFVNV